MNIDTSRVPKKHRGSLEVIFMLITKIVILHNCTPETAIKLLAASLNK